MAKVKNSLHVRSAKPTDYKVVAISLYMQDIARLDELVAELRRRGFTKASRSAVIRFAVEGLDPKRVPPGGLR